MGFTNGRLLGRMAEIAIVSFAVLVAINQLGIAADLINILFIGIVASLALAFGLAFGLGGRDVAAQVTQDFYAGMSSATGKVIEAASAADDAATTSTSRSTQASPSTQIDAEPGPEAI